VTETKNTAAVKLVKTATVVQEVKKEAVVVAQEKESVSAGARGKYARQLAKLKNMGFKDEEMLTDLLVAAGGKEQQVIDWLIQPVV